MADWTKPFESGWRWVRVSRLTGYETEQLPNLTTGSLTINSDTDTFESASVDCIGALDVGNDLVRCYLDATWPDGTTESVCMGTWLPSIPSRDVSGSYQECSVQLDGRLLELAEDSFENIYTVKANQNPVSKAKSICEGANLKVVQADTFSGTLGTNWRFGLDGMNGEGIADSGSKLQAVNGLLAAADFRAAQTDPFGNVVFRKDAEIDSTTPVWDFREGPSATFLNEATDEFDATDVANKVIAVFETEGATTIGIATDTDPASPWSTVSMGRTKAKVYNFDSAVTQAQANRKAADLLRTQQSVVHRVTIQHVHCPVRVGDVVSINYGSAGIAGTFIVRTQDVDLGSAGCLTKSELRRFVRAK